MRRRLAGAASHAGDHAAQPPGAAARPSTEAPGRPRPSRGGRVLSSGSGATRRRSRILRRAARLATSTSAAASGRTSRSCSSQATMHFGVWHDAPFLRRTRTGDDAQDERRGPRRGPPVQRRVNQHDLAAVAAVIADDILFENTNPAPDGTASRARRPSDWLALVRLDPGATFETRTRSPPAIAAWCAGSTGRSGTASRGTCAASTSSR